MAYFVLSNLDYYNFANISFVYRKPIEISLISLITEKVQPGHRFVLHHLGRGILVCLVLVVDQVPQRSSTGADLGSDLNEPTTKHLIAAFPLSYST